ncbi:hypothetical protein C8R47DRAFT_1200275 [Mycena vitilis]|nr:hypothetical protein C8R47DRAFT_1200275 [Mycena vitilis]
MACLAWLGVKNLKPEARARSSPRDGLAWLDETMACHLGNFSDLAEFAQLVTSPALAELTLHQILLSIPNDGEMLLKKHVGLEKLVFDLESATQHIVTHWLVRGNSLSNLRRLCHWNTLSFAKLKQLRILEITVAVETACDALAHLFAHLLESCSRGLVKFGFSVSLLSEPPAIEWQPLRDILTTAIFPMLANVDFWATTIGAHPAFQSDHPENKFYLDFQHGVNHLVEQRILNLAKAARGPVYPVVDVGLTSISLRVMRVQEGITIFHQIRGS